MIAHRVRNAPPLYPSTPGQIAGRFAETVCDRVRCDQATDSFSVASFLLRHGRMTFGGRPPRFLSYPGAADPFRTAARAAAVRRGPECEVEYVEGYAYVPEQDLIYPHAWVQHAGRVHELTWDFAPFADHMAYLGVPLRPRAVSARHRTGSEGPDPLRNSVLFAAGLVDSALMRQHAGCFEPMLLGPGHQESDA
jgi:hypothetical protein